MRVVTRLVAAKAHHRELALAQPWLNVADAHPGALQVTDTQVQKSSSLHSSALYQEELATEKELAQFSANSKPYELPALADSILERGMSLIGTRYRFGGTSEAGFDCSGFIGYLFKEEAGMQLPRSTREMINVNAPLVARNNLKPGDLLFFSTNGRGRVSHAGIYLGDDHQ